MPVRAVALANGTFQLPSAALWNRVRGAQPLARARALAPQLRHHWPALAAVAAAVALRVYRVFPNPLYGDEAEYATVARSLAQNPLHLAYPDIEGVGPAPFVSQPPLALYLFAFAARVLGSMEAAVVTVSLLFGVVTVLCAYAIGVQLHGRAAGAFAAATMALVPMHVSLSRQGLLDEVLTGTTALAILAFLLWARHGSWRWALATGLAVAAATMAKIYGFLVLVPLAAGFALQASPQLRDRAQRARLLLHGTLMTAPTLVAAVAYLALLAYLRAIRDLTEKLLWQFGRVVPAAATAAPLEAETRPWHWYLTDFGSGLPWQLGFIVLILALAGGWSVLARSRDGRLPPHAAMVALWPLVIVAFFSLSGRKEWFYPAAAAPGVAVLAGVAIGTVWDSSQRWIRTGGFVRRGRAALVATLLALPLASPATSAVDMVMTRGNGFGHGLVEAAEWIDQQDPSAVQVGTILGRFTLHYYNGHPTYHMYVPHWYIDEEIAAGRVQFVVIDHYIRIAEDVGYLESLVQRHDGRLVHEVRDARGRVMVQVFALNAGG